MLPEQAGKQQQCWLRSGEAVELVLRWEKETFGYRGIREEQLKDRITCCSLVLGYQRRRVKRKILRVLQEGK